MRVRCPILMNIQASPSPYTSTRRLFLLCGKPSKVSRLTTTTCCITSDSILLDFIQEHPQLLPADNAMDFLSDDGGESYNRCHCSYVLLH
jgi:hypothetical protein